MAPQDTNDAAWGGTAAMSAWEALMWRAEADPRTRSTGVLLEILDREPDWDRLVAAHDRVSRQIPRLRVLVEGLEDGRAGYLLKVHHSLSDGLGLIQLLTLAHSRTPEPGDHQLAPPAAPRPLLTPASLLANRLRQRLADAPSELIRRSEDSLKLMGRTVRNPGAVAGDTLRFGRSLRRVLAPRRPHGRRCCAAAVASATGSSCTMCH